MLPELPKRIECFDISHIQGAETVASLVVWENGAMKKSDYRKFQIKTVEGVDDFASMREVVARRYKRVAEENKAMPSLILIDGGLGQLHAAAAALEELGFTSQPLASIAKREEIIYLYGQEDDPIVLDRRSPVLHLVQRIRDESHRFAISYHRKRREMRDRDSELLEIPGVGARTRTRLLEHFGSLRSVQSAGLRGADGGRSTQDCGADLRLLSCRNIRRIRPATDTEQQPIAYLGTFISALRSACCIRDGNHISGTCPRKAALDSLAQPYLRCPQTCNPDRRQYPRATRRLRHLPR